MPEPQDSTEGADTTEMDGEAIVPEVETEEMETSRRDFRITKQVIDKYGHTLGCKGCDAHRQGKCRDHSKVCRKRIADQMIADDVLRSRISSRNTRLERSDTANPLDKE